MWEKPDFFSFVQAYLHFSQDIFLYYPQEKGKG